MRQNRLRDVWEDGQQTGDASAPAAAGLQEPTRLAGAEQGFPNFLLSVRSDAVA
jgi:hypothetical protein